MVKAAQEQYMANQRTTFGKRQREQNRKDKARAKQERLEARRASSGGQKGPPIAWDEAVQVEDSSTDVPGDAPTPTSDETSDGST
jgi:hypothetical protein